MLGRQAAWSGKAASERDGGDSEASLLCAVGDKGQLLRGRSVGRSQKASAKGRVLLSKKNDHWRCCTERLTQLEKRVGRVEQ